MRHQRGDILVTLIIYAVIAAAIVGAVWGVYYKIDHTWETRAGIARGEKDRQKEWDAAVDAQALKEAEQAAEATTKLGEQNAKAKVVYRTITQQVDRIVDRPVLRNVCLDPDGLQFANAALIGPTGRAPDKPDRALPSTQPPAGRDGGISAPKAGGGLGVILRLPETAPSGR